MTLTEAAYWTRRFGVIAVAAIAFLIIVITIVYSLPKNTTPPEYTKANYACTATKEEFLKNELNIPTLQLGADSERNFGIETETGTIDSLPRVVNVYKYNNIGLLTNAQDSAKDIAKKLNFDPLTITRRGSLETTEYIWSDPTTSRTLTITAKNLNFSLKTDFTKPNAIPEGTLMTDDQAISTATGILRTLGKLSEDYAKEKPSVIYLSIEPDGSFKQVTAKADAKLIRVDFIRKKAVITVNTETAGAKDIKADLESKGFTSETETITTTDGKYETYNFKTLVAMLDPFKSYVSVYIGVSPKKSSSKSTYTEVVGIDYTDWHTDTTPCGTYELTPPSVAIENLQRGNSGSLVYLREKNADTVVQYQPQSVSKFTILEVKIMYYDSPQEATFMQPIYRIRGLATLKSGINGEFYYYIPAINYDTVQDRAADYVAPTVTSNTTKTTTE